MATKNTVLLTRRWPKVVEDALAESYDLKINETDVPLDAAAMQHAFETADAVLATVTDKISPACLNSSERRTKIIGNYGVGFSHIDIDAARSAGVVVTNTPDVLSECTADIAMTLMLMTCRRAGEGEREVRSGQWTGWRPTHLVGSRLSGKTLGVIGFGRIGQETARRAHHGFGMKVLAHNRSAINRETLQQTSAVQLDTVEELLQQSDFVTLHCPGGVQTRHLINAQRLALMKTGAFLINTARGEVIDEAALVDALRDGKLGGAGLDVFEQEPKVHAGLLELENAVLLPHLGSATAETREAMGLRVMKNLDAFFAGQTPPDQVV